MREHEYKHLLAERNTLQGFLADTHTHFIERMSWQSRLDNINRQIESITPDRLSKTATITFRGKPVDRSFGITAEFSGKAIDSLNDMVATVVASLNNKLNYMGAIPDRDQHKLMITGTAVGSFGFEFELPEPDHTLFADRNTAENALTDIQTLFELALHGSDEEISTIIDAIHPRAVQKVSDFLELIQKYESTFAVEYNNKITRIGTNQQLATVIDRLSSDNISERTETYKGEFQGVLPKSRTFEFKEISHNIIKGKIGINIEDPDIINRDYLYKPLSATFNVVQFGQAKPKYTLSKLEDINNY